MPARSLPFCLLWDTVSMVLAAVTISCEQRTVPVDISCHNLTQLCWARWWRLVPTVLHVYPAFEQRLCCKVFTNLLIICRKDLLYSDHWHIPGQSVDWLQNYWGWRILTQFAVGNFFILVENRRCLCYYYFPFLELALDFDSSSRRYLCYSTVPVTTRNRVKLSEMKAKVDS